jgi:hypothetical protein
MLTLGIQENPAGPSVEKEFGDLQILERMQSGQLRLVCPPGSLARLPQHHAFAKLADGTVTKTPVWLEPSFHEFIPVPVPAQADDLADAVSLLKCRDEDMAVMQADVPLFLVHMHRRRHALRLTPNVVAAAWQLCKSRDRRNPLLASMTGKVQGLEELPSCWLRGLIQWLQKNSSLAPAIVRASVRSGVLWPELDRAWKLWGDGPLMVPEAINLFVYPSLWRPLLPRHLAQLMIERPDLRAEIESLPQVAQHSEEV